MIKHLLACLLIACCGTTMAQKPAAIPIDKVWSGHPVGFDIHTTDKFQYVCYYDSARNMVIAQRPLSSGKWKKTILPSVLGWDSHNYVAMAIDKQGYLHVSGNMHNVPMIYFRSKTPENIDAFDNLPMTGKNEDRATYPVFFKDKAGDLYFQYRNGGSGDGITYWNKYNTDTKQWMGLFDTPLFDGEGESNAYMTDPKAGPDGYFYVVWMWRLTPTANTNHNLSCIRSKDLVNWENLNGAPISLPIKWRDNLPVVDPVGPWNGLINMGFKVSWNNDKVPYITYHKYDINGVSQLFAARFEKSVNGNGSWHSYQLSNWKDFTWPLNLGGSLNNSIGITALRPSANKQLAVDFFHEKYGKGTWLVDEKTMTVKNTLPLQPAPELPLLAEDNLPGMSWRTKPDNTGKFRLRWQTLPANQDRPRQGTPPAPTELVLYEFK